MSHIINFKQYIFSTDYYFLSYFDIYMLRGVFHVLSICVPYAFGVFRGLKGVGTSELELQLVVCLLVGTGN